MLEQGFSLFVLAGTSYAAYLDLRTSEVPDWVSLTVAGGSILYYGYRGLLVGSPDPLIASLASGTALFLFGWAMYMAGMWGGADAFVLGAVGYAFPSIPSAFFPQYAAPWPAPVSLLLTVFLLGSVYSTVYAVVLALRTDRFWTKFREELEERRRRYAAAVLLYTAVAGAATALLYTTFTPPALLVARNFTASLLLLAAVLGLVVFLRTVESRVMEREIPVSELEEGHVLAEEIEVEELRDDPAERVSDSVLVSLRSLLPFRLPGLLAGHSERIAGLTAEQVEEVAEKRDSVTVRTGVRFIPAFPAAVVVLLFFGDPLYFLLLQVL